MKRKVQEQDRMKMSGDDFYFLSEEEMRQNFPDHPEAVDNTQKIADQCNLDIPLRQYKLPHYELENGVTANEYLKKLCQEKIARRYPKITSEITDRLNYELQVIEKTGFASYFLIVQDFINWAKNSGIVVGPGRGSAAGSIIAYILNITNIDPLTYGLMFERFLNPERISMPDMDLDFADTRRDEVLQYVTQKYGSDHVAQIITFGTMASRAAVRDVGRVLDFPYSFCNQLSKSIPMGSSLSEAEELAEVKKILNENEGAKKIFSFAKRLEGVVRHASRHACGVVITPQPLTEYLPLQYEASGAEKAVISQYEMHAIEELGLLKMDFLGLKNLTTINKAVKIIKIIENKEVDIDKIPFDDKKTFSLLQKAQTAGVFQMESEGMRRCLKQLKPTHIDDLIAMVALYRPGPIEWIPDYIAGKHGKKVVEYLHPKLEPILSKTYGICIYQEQLLQIARDLAGFSLGEADILRKAVGKKIIHLLQQQKNKFIEGCVKNGVKKHIAERVFSFIEPFANYGFNKSHAACYAVIAYQTAYLKANHPLAFMAALLTADIDDLDRIAMEVEEAKKMDIEVLPPDINESFELFTAVDGKIRFGLLAIKNIGEGVAHDIIEERKTNGNFQNLTDFLSRLPEKNINKKFLEGLIKSGALDKMGERKCLLENMETLLEFAKQKQKNKNNGQSSLFASMKNGNHNEVHLQPTPPAQNEEKLFWEKELLGLFISQHPLDEYREIIKKHATPINELKNNSSGKILGIITEVKKILTKDKNNMFFLTIEDPWGKIEALVFPKLALQSGLIFENNNFIFVRGRINDKDDDLKMVAEKIKYVTSSALDELLLKEKKLIN
jgi:DNA polymerase-3 subunit alpha